MEAKQALAANERRDFKISAVDYPMHPVDPEVLRARIRVILAGGSVALDDENLAMGIISRPRLLGAKIITGNILCIPRKNLVE